MSAQDWERLEKNLNRIGQMAALLKLVIGSGVAVTVSIGAIFVWVHQTTVTLASTRDDLVALTVKREIFVKEVTDWRRQKDEIDIQLIGAPPT